MLINLLPWLAFAVVAVTVFGIGRWMFIRAEDEPAPARGQLRRQTLIFGR